MVPVDRPGDDAREHADRREVDQTWDAEGDLEKVAKGTENTSFVYDADGNRLLRRDASGTTLYFDMPLNAHPPTIDASAFDLKRQAAEAQSLVDFALWGGIVPGNLDRLQELAERGVTPRLSVVGGSQRPVNFALPGPF